MVFRGVRLGTFLVPLAVAIVPATVLIWYAFVHMPAQESYLNERNLRLLMTVSGNIKTKVDNFDNAIDHAVESFGIDTDPLRAGVHMFAPDLDIVDVRRAQPPAPDGDADIAELALADAADPPRIRIDRDEGRSYLYLGARVESGKQTAWIVAKTDIDQVVGSFLSARGEFDAVLLVTQSGEVIVQRSPIGLALARVDSVLAARTPPAGDHATPLVPFDLARHFSTMTPVRLGEVDYKLYMQPVPLSLLASDARRPDQWVLCGLVRADRFRTESSSLSISALLVFSAALAAVFLAIPFVKLKAIRPRERLRAGDARWLAAAAFSAVGLIAIGALDVIVFGFAFPRAIDARLSTVADEISRHLADEVDQIDREGQSFDESFDGAFQKVTDSLGARQSPRLKVSTGGAKALSCDPAAACKTAILDRWRGDAREHPYPYVYLVALIAQNGWQRVKWTPSSGLTPFINIREERLAYYADLQRAWRHPAGADAPPARGVSVLESPNTGEPLTVFWRARPTADEEKAYSQSLAIFSPIALDRPPMPKGVSFAVVDQDGRTIFHSDQTRSLHENFVKECEDNSALRASLGALNPPPLNAYYRARLNRLHVQPLLLGPFGDPHWSLVVFQDSASAGTVNLETVTLACMLFAIYGVLLACCAILLPLIAPAPAKWFWPAGGNELLYARVAWGNAAVACALAVLLLTLPPGAALVSAVVIAIGAAFVTRWAIARGRTSTAPPALGPTHPFYAARAACLLVVAGLPAVACFEAAYTFETRLLATNEQIQAGRERDARGDRVDRFVSRFGLQEASSLDAFTARRQNVEWDSVRAPLWPSTAAADPQTLDHMLAWMHRPYNDVAIDLQGTTGSALVPRAASALDAASLGVIAIGLFGLCYTLAVVLVKPVFGLALAVAGPMPAEEPAALARNTLIIGPPGSGKSTLLAARPNIRVFDVTRLAFVERRRQSKPVPVEQRRPAAAAAAAGEGRWSGWSPFEPAADATSARPAQSPASSWADEFDYSTLSGDESAIFGIDHLDHRLEEPEFAAQTLRFLEQVVHRSAARIRVVCDRDPVVCLETSNASSADLDRWTRALSGFRQEVVPVREKPIAEASDESFTPYHQALWHACTVDERLVLCQLAQEELINPQNVDVARRLVRIGLIVRDPFPRVMTESFRRFVLQAASADQIAAWERRGVSVPWSSIEFAMMTVVFGLAGLLVLTQEQLVGAWIGFVPTIVPAAQRVWTLVASMSSPSSAGDHA